MTEVIVHAKKPQYPEYQHKGCQYFHTSMILQMGVLNSSKIQNSYTKTFSVMYFVMDLSSNFGFGVKDEFCHLREWVVA